MRRIVVLIVSMVLMQETAFGSAQQEVEQHFQNGLAYSQQGDLDTAYEEFEKVVLSDDSGLEERYVIETYSEAYYDMGMIRAKQEQWVKSIELFVAALKVNPNHFRASYYLAFSWFVIGEIKNAFDYYLYASDNGFIGNPAQGDIVGQELAAFTNKQFVVNYQSAFDSTKIISVKIDGNPIGEEELIKDVINGLEKYRKMAGKGLFDNAAVQFIRIFRNDNMYVEKWTIVENGNPEVYWIEYNTAPPPDFPFAVQINISDKEYPEL